MINTYQTSLAPPPVPPRLGMSHQVIIPEQVSSRVHSKSVLHLLVGVVLLHFFLSIGGFIYLFNDKMVKENEKQPPMAEGGKMDRRKMFYGPLVKQEPSNKTLARMIVKRQNLEEKLTPGYLQWDMKHSFRRDINYSHKSWVTILQPGDYYVYSRVTFSKGSGHPLTTMVILRENENGEEKTVMKAYCNLDIHSGSHLCTASQGDVITLKNGNQLSVWVQDLLLVNYEDSATTFGMYKL